MAVPVVAPVPVCKLGERCHVSGKGLTTFGTKFPLATVQRLASCCIQLADINFNDPTKPDLRIASGVLIAPEVALFAAHSMGTLGSSPKVIMDFECDTSTAPPGMASQHKNVWPSCTPLANAAQAVIGKTLEIGSSTDFDYAMVQIKWSSVTPAGQVSLPRIPVFPKHGFVFSNELLVIGHPDPGPKQQCEPTQACAFKLVNAKAPNPANLTDPNNPDTYGYGGPFGFDATTGGEGLSGGGVFNEQGELIGLLKGDTVNAPGGGSKIFAFLNLGLAAGKTMNDPRRGRLLQWIKTGNPLLPARTDPFTKASLPADPVSSPPITFV